MALSIDFPQHDFERGTTLLQALGSFWTQVFMDTDRLEHEMLATGEVFLQTQLDFLEAAASLSRFELPVFHKKRWHILFLKKSQLITGSGFLAYGEGGVYGPQPESGNFFFYGQPAFERFVFDIAELSLDTSVFITNRVIDPSVVLSRGVDFTVDLATKTIRFDQDPFENKLFARRSIYKDNEIVDEEIVIWFFMGDFDRENIFNHFGYALQVAMSQSSEFYKDFINAFWNMFTRTPTLIDVRALLSAISGISSAIEAEEVVEFIEITSGRLNIITPTRVYQFPPTALPVVAVGDTIKAGDELVDTLKIIELSGSNKDVSEIPAVSLGDEFLSGGFFAQLIFENRQVELDFQGIDNDGKTFVKFEVGGFPGDEDLFWELAQRRGKELGATLAELLDTRTNPPTDPSLPPEITQPGPEHLPELINPMEFIIDNVLKNNLFIIKLKSADINREAVGLDFFHVLRSAIPPHTTFIVFVETPAISDTINLGQPGGVDPCVGIEGDEPGVQDESFNDSSCTVIPLINVFEGPDELEPMALEPDKTEVIGVVDPGDGTAWIQETLISPRIIEGELL